MLLLKFLVDSKQISEVLKHWFQTLEYQGPNSRFVLKAIIKALISKLSRSSILITLNNVHSNNDSQPNLNLSDYLKNSQPKNLQRYLNMVSWHNKFKWQGLSPYSRWQIPFIQNSTWSTNVGIKWSNESYFQITKPGRVICRSLIDFLKFLKLWWNVNRPTIFAHFSVYNKTCLYRFQDCTCTCTHFTLPACENVRCFHWMN